MKDKEFSGGGREFSSPGREFSDPGREWASQPPEMDRSGREYRQESAPPAKPEKKKRRRAFQPAALTAAVLVTAAIVLGPAFSSGPPQADRPGVQLPTQDLSAEHRAYLDAVWENMEEADLDELEELARDPMLEDILINAVDPFLERVKVEYGSEDGVVTIGTGYHKDTFDLSSRGNVYYNGETLVIGDPGSSHLDFSYTIWDPNSDSEDTWVHFYLRVPEYLNSFSEIYDERRFFLSFGHIDSDHVTSKDWDHRAMIYRSDGSAQVPEPFGEWSIIRISEIDRSALGRGSTVREDRMEGQFFWVNGLPDERGRIPVWPCLYNGQATMSYSGERGSASGTVYVENGYTTGWDDAFIMEMEDGRPISVPKLRVSDYDSITMSFTREFASSDSDHPLFAQFRDVEGRLLDAPITPWPAVPRPAP